MTRPVIGICTSLERVSWGAWTVVANVSPRSYALAVHAAGGMALLLPPDDGAAERPEEMLDLLDGLMLAGGADIDPASYGARPHPETRGSWPERDRFELALAHAALDRDMPVLGICRTPSAASVIVTLRAASMTTRYGSARARSRHAPWGRRPRA